MKRITFILLFFLVSSSVQSQELGVRFGDAVGGNVSIDMIVSIGDFSRVHGDVSFGNGLGVEALYDFLYRPLGAAEGFNWYVGAGPYVFIGDPFQFGIAGELGLEYHFAEIPLALGADWRPAFRIVDNTDFIWDGFGFNIRYVFSSVR